MVFLKKLFENVYIISIMKKANVILFGLISTSLLNRYLGPELRGEYAYILSIVSIFIVVANFGMNLTYPNYRRNNVDALKTYFSISIIEFLFLMTVSFVVYIITVDITIFFMLIMITVSVFRLQVNYYNLVENIKSHSFITVGASLFNSIILLLLFVFAKSNLLYVLIVYLCKEIFIIILSIKELNTVFSFSFLNCNKVMKIIYKGLIPMYTTFLISLNYKIDIVLLNSFSVDNISIGLYSVGVSLAEYGWLVPDIFKDVMINKTARNDNIASLCFSLRMSSTLMILVYMFMFIFGELLIKILFGIEFIEAYGITIIIFLGIYSMIYCKIIGTLYISKGNWKFYAIVLTVTALINIILNIVLIPILSTNGAAIASIISYTTAGGTFVYSFTREYGIKLRDVILIRKSDVISIKKIISRAR